MRILFPMRWLLRGRRWWLPAAVLAAIAAMAFSAYELPQSRVWLAGACRRAETLCGGKHDEEAKGHSHQSDLHDHDGHDDADGDHDEHAHAVHDADGDEHDHVHAPPQHYNHKHDDAAAIKLSQQAQGNIGLHLAKVELRQFERTITVPGMVVERPGWSVLEVTTPVAGVVTRIYPIQGEAVRPGQPLFEVRLTHEDLLQAQTDFLRTIEELDVTGREVDRLEKASADGVIPAKTILERKYEQQKQNAHLRVQRQSLLLRGLSQEQADKIAATRTLLQFLTVRAPTRDKASLPAGAANSWQVQQLKVDQGKHINTGDTLCTLVDYEQLYVEGNAFEQDVQAVNRAAAAGRKVAVVLGTKSTGDDDVAEGLRILYLGDKVDRESRAFSFYVSLPNRLLRREKSPDGREFVYWRFKPGQRTEIRIPVEQWEDRVVLPVEAVAQEGAEFYVFEANDDHLDRRPVHVEYRDQQWVVIANDGSLPLGATVAVSAAHQMQLALKNKAGGGVDPHAGHNH